MALSDWLYATTDATHRIALERLALLVAEWLQTQGMEPAAATALLASDHAGKVNLPREHATAHASRHCCSARRGIAMPVGRRASQC